MIEAKMNNAYVVYSRVLDKSTYEPMLDIFIASDKIKAEELFLRDFPNAIETLIKSELIATDVARTEGALEFNPYDWLYLELWETVGVEKVLRIREEAEDNTKC